MTLKILEFHHFISHTHRVDIPHTCTPSTVSVHTSFTVHFILILLLVAHTSISVRMIQINIPQVSLNVGKLNIEYNNATMLHSAYSVAIEIGAYICSFDFIMFPFADNLDTLQNDHQYVRKCSVCVRT